jgi:DNA (cytosine-5)-methyltransferase 1
MNSGKAAGSATQQDAEAGMLVTAPVSCRPYADRGAEEYGLITHSLRGEGFDASEDGTGRGTPLVPVAYAIQERAICENPDAGPDGIGVRGDGTAYTVEARQVPRAVAFRAAGQDGFTSSAVCPPIASTDGGGAGVPTICFDSRQDTCCYEDHTGALDSSSPQAQAVAFVQNTRDEVRLMGGDGQSVGALSAEPGMKQQCYVAVGLDEEQNAHEEQMGYLKARKEGGGFEGSVMTPAMQVRRLTPVECERLQGVPDSFTAIPYRGKTMADGPRYKMLGNGFAIPVVSWIGSRIQQVEDLK